MKYLKVISINLLLLVIGALILEEILPVISIPIHSNRKINLNEHSPNQNKEINIKGTEKTINFFTDNNGFLNENQNGKVTAIFFGGSTTENILVNPEKRFPKLLQDKVSNYYGEKIRILNGGVSGNNNLNNLFSFLAKGIPYRPEYVFLMGTLNDYFQLKNYGSYWKINNNQSVLNSDRSILYTFLNYLKIHFFTNIYYNLKSTGLFQNISNSSPYDLKIKSNEFLGVIKSFNNISKNFSIKFVFLTEPYLELKYGEENVRNLYSTLQDSEIQIIDLERKVPKQPIFFIDNTHLSEEGNEIVSEIIFEEIFINNKKNNTN